MRTLLLILLSVSLHAQTIEQYKRSTLKMIQGRECEINLKLADSSIVLLDSINKSYARKLNQSNALILIHKSVEAGQAKEIEKLNGKVGKEHNRKVFWRKLSLFIIGFDVAVCLGTYYLITK